MKRKLVEIVDETVSSETSESIKRKFESNDEAISDEIDSLMSTGCTPSIEKDACETQNNLQQCNTVTETSSMDIAAMILAERQFLSEASCYSDIPRPLFVAMRAGDINRVKVILKSGSSLTKKTLILSCVDEGEKWPNSVSAIQFACLLNQPEMLKLILSYNGNQIREQHEIENDNNPLHHAVSLAQMCWRIRGTNGERRFNLANIVKVMIKAGVAVDGHNKNGATALWVLLSSILCLISLDLVVLDLGDLQIIVETVKILLEAGACPNGQNYKSNCLIDIVMRINVKWCNQKYPSQQQQTVREHTTHKIDHFPMITATLQLLLKHGADLTNQKVILGEIFNFAIRLQAAQPESPAVKMREYLINGLCDMYRTIIFCGHTLYAPTSSVTRQSTLLSIDSNEFWDMARYTSECVLARPMMWLRLNFIPVAEVENFRKILFRISPSVEFERRNTAAVRYWLNTVQMPGSLKHLARISVIRLLSLKYRPDVSRLGLPKQLQDYILMK